MPVSELLALCCWDATMTTDTPNLLNIMQAIGSRWPGYSLSRDWRVSIDCNGCDIADGRSAKRSGLDSLVGNDCAGQTPGMALDDPTQYHRIAPGPTDVTHLLVDTVSAMP